jgi:CRISPR-associated protein Csm5
MVKSLDIKAKAFMPVHVGGGEDHKLDPLGYVVKGDWFYRINISYMLEADKTFSQIFVKTVENKNAISRLRKVIADAFNPEDSKMWIHRAKVSASFKEAYIKNFDDLNLKNQLLVQCFPLTGNRAYLPGSSIKGAIRTAVLDSLSDGKEDEILAKAENRIHNPKERYKLGEYVEKIILKYEKVQDDPFKGIKLSDAVLPPDSTMIVKVINCGKDTIGKKDNGVPMFVEALTEKTEFEFRLITDDNLVLNQNNPKIDAYSVLQKCAEYYTDAFSSEETNFYKIGTKASNLVQDIIYEVLDDKDEKKKGISVLRVGRFSHLESMTYSHRPANNEDDIKKFLCQPKGRNGKWGTTRNLVDGKIPMGGIVLYYPE